MSYNVLLLCCVVCFVQLSAFQHGRLCRVTNNILGTSLLAKVPEVDEKGKPKMTLGGIVQLMAMGAGAPMLGEFKEVDKDGKMIFELEANNFGKETNARYFTDGYVEEENADSPPGFWQNLASGGRLQTEWESAQAAKRKQGPSKKK